MKSRSIYHSPVTRTTISQNQLRDLVQFLALNRQSIVIPAEVSRRIMMTRSLSQTPIQRLFSRAMDLGKDRLVSLLDIPVSVTAPEVMTYQHITFDTLQFKDVSDHFTKALEPTPFANKLIINATPWLTRQGEVSDMLALQGAVVRDMLSRSYYMADRTWISPTITRYVCKVYSMSLATTVAGIYNLTYAEQQAVTAVFAYFYLSKTVPAKDVNDMFKSSASFIGIDRAADVDMILELMTAHKVDPETMTLEDACVLITKLGISRMSTMSVRVLHGKARSWGPDVHTSALALEFPPYFVYLMLLAGSGRKIGLSFTLKRLGADREMKKFGEDLLTSTGFIGAL